MLVLAVAHPPEPDVGVRDVPREHLLEATRAHVPAEPERPGPAPMPTTRAAVLGVVLPVVPVFLKVLHLGLGGADCGDGGDHGAGLT